MENIYKLLIPVGAILTAIAGYMIFAGIEYSGYVFLTGIAVYLLVIFFTLLENNTRHENS